MQHLESAWGRADNEVVLSLHKAYREIPSLTSVWHGPAGFRMSWLYDENGRIRYPDRLYLLESILPAFGELLEAQSAVPSVLNVGVRLYAMSPEHILRQWAPNLLFATIDPDPASSIYGSTFFENRSRHYVGRIENIENFHSGEPKFCIVILSGVIGQGLNTPEDILRAARAIHNVLLDDVGILIMFRDEDPTKSRREIKNDDAKQKKMDIKMDSTLQLFIGLADGCYEHFDGKGIGLPSRKHIGGGVWDILRARTCRSEGWRTAL